MDSPGSPGFSRQSCNISLFSESPYVSRTNSNFSVDLKVKIVNKKIDSKLKDIEKKRKYIQLEKEELQVTEMLLEEQLSMTVNYLLSQSTDQHVVTRFIQNTENIEVRRFERFCQTRLPRYKTDKRRKINCWRSKQDEYLPQTNYMNGFKRTGC